MYDRRRTNLWLKMQLLHQAEVVETVELRHPLGYE